MPNTPGGRLKYLVLIVISLSILLSILIYIYNIPGRPIFGDSLGVDAGSRARIFNFMDIDGNNYSLSDFEGSIVILEFSAVWCPACRRQKGVFKAIYDEYRDYITIITIDIDAPLDVLREYRSSQGIEWIVASGSDIASIYEVYVLPTIVVIDESGYIIYRGNGFTEYETLKDILDKIIGG